MAEFGSIRKLKSGRFQARYMYKGVTVKGPETYATKRLAASWLGDELKRINAGTWIHPDEVAERQRKQEEAKALTVGKWLGEYHHQLETRINPVKRSTMQVYRRIVRNRITEPEKVRGCAEVPEAVTFLANLPLNRVSQDDIYRWWDGITGFFATPTTNQKAYVRLRAAFEAAKERGLIEKNVVLVKAAGNKVKTQARELVTTKDIDMVIEAMDPNFRMISSLVLRHGVRIGEALAIEKSDIHFFEGDRPLQEVPEHVTSQLRAEVVVTKNLQRIVHNGHTRMEKQTTKTAAGNRVVPILKVDLPLYVQHLNNYAPKAPLQIHEGETGLTTFWPATVTLAGGVLMDTTYRSLLSRARLVAGVEVDIKPHSGRRWLITRLAEVGAHPQEIGALLGQNDMDTILKIYLQVNPRRQPQLLAQVDESIREERSA